MRAAGQQQMYGGDGGAYNSAVYASQQQQYPGGPRGPAANMPGGPAATHMAGAAPPGVGPPQPSPRGADDPMVGPMKTGSKASSMFASGSQQQQQQQLQQQRSAPYPNPHRYLQSRRPQFINGQATEVCARRTQIPLPLRWTRARSIPGRPFHFQTTTFGKLFTHMCLRHKAA